MKIFTALQTQWGEFMNGVQRITSEKLGRTGAYGPSNIIGQIYTVLNGAVQNLMLYIEDAFTEQNVYTAQRKKSIYSLAKLSGYEPSLGSASKCSIKLIYNSESGLASSSVIIPNKTTLVSTQNGLIYNIILPHEACVFNVNQNNALSHVAVVEGVFETQEFTVEGGELYTINIPFNGDTDIDYMSVIIDGEVWERVDCLYDMQPDGKQYVAKTSLNKGIDLVFGNGQYGHILKRGDKITVEYLSHNGELGNINPDDDISFVFSSPLTDVLGNEVDGNSYFRVELEDRTGVSSGSYSETAKQVKEMIGYNSRSLVLADARNYKIFFNKFSFVGYNRCWSENGSLVVNALALKDYSQLCENGADYFSLNENDFKLSKSQEDSIKQAIIDSGQQIGGAIFNFVEPILKKYALFAYVKMKQDVLYDEDLISNQIKNIIGNFFGNIKSDIYVPKAELIQQIKNNIPQIDGVNIYFVSEDNEIAKHSISQTGNYVTRVYNYNYSTNKYEYKEKTIIASPGSDPHIGLDDHGNILLETDIFFPILKGGWKILVDDTQVTIGDDDPVQIIFQ